MEIAFVPGSPTVDCYDYYELVIRVTDPDFGNPFTDAEVIGQFGEDKEPFSFKHGQPDGQFGTAVNSDELIPVDGFCDADDGSIYRLRFMPRKEGRYRYTATFKHGTEIRSCAGEFEAKAAGRRGPLRVDPGHPFHFVWEGTGEHFFYNAMTAYHMPGIKDEREIERAIDRFHAHKINRLRMAISSSRVRNAMAWFEPVYESDSFTFLYGPWAAAAPDDAEKPGWDYTRFDISYWQKLDRLLRYARDRDIVISVIMYLDAYRQGADPFGKLIMGGLDEQRYFRYAAARLSAFANVTWDLTNEYRLIRPHEWVERMGYFLRACDPYRHLITCHGHGTFEFRMSGWADFAVYQSWDEHGGYHYMLGNREQQRMTGRIIPQVNEEYGYEDHYPSAWGNGKTAPARSADSLRRRAWEIYMAGCYQTAGEYAGSGAGGWLNGRADGSMKLLEGFARIAAFFEACEWWKANPHREIVSDPDCYCLADPGALYIVYAPTGQDVGIALPEGEYEAVWYNPRTGLFGEASIVRGTGEPIVVACPDRSGDMALRLLGYVPVPGFKHLGHFSLVCRGQGGQAHL